MLPLLVLNGKTLWVSRLLENIFSAIVDLKRLNDTDVHNKLQSQVPLSSMQISLCIILLTRISIPSKTDFRWSHLHIEFSQKSLFVHAKTGYLMSEITVKFQSYVRH